MRSNGLASLWLRNVPTNSNTQVQPPADIYYSGLRFSRDGNYFYFVRSDPGNPELKFLYRAPLLGGVPDKLVSDIDSNITFSPDGQQFAFIRADNPEPGKYRLIIRSVSGGDERIVTGGSLAEGLYQPSWSPDGKTIACIAIQNSNTPQGIITIDLATGKKITIFAAAKKFVGYPTWLPDGSGFLALSWDQSSNFTRSQIVFVSKDGVLTPVTRDTNDYSDLSLAGSGHLLASVLNAPRWNLYLMQGAADPAPRVLSSSSAFTDLTWTPGGQLIMDQNNGLTMINPQTGAKLPIATEEGHPAGDPSSCADGKYTVFVLGFHGNSTDQNIWRVDSGGGNLKQLTDGKNDTYPVCSPDSHWVYYISQKEENRLSRVPIDGGAQTTVSEQAVSPTAITFDISPDGKLAAFPTLEHSGEHKEKLRIRRNRLRTHHRERSRSPALWNAPLQPGRKRSRVFDARERRR